MNELTYNEKKDPDLLSLAKGAELAGVSYSRFRKTVQRLKTPVIRHGWIVLIRRAEAKAVKRAIQGGVIRRGRPKKKGRNGSDAEPTRVQDV